MIQNFIEFAPLRTISCFHLELFRPSMQARGCPQQGNLQPEAEQYLPVHGHKSAQQKHGNSQPS